MSQINTLRIQKVLELAEIDGRKLLKDLIEVETSVNEYRRTLESLMRTLTETNTQLEEDSIAF